MGLGSLAHAGIDPYQAIRRVAITRRSLNRQGDKTMFKNLLIIGLTLITAACVPISPEASAEMPEQATICDSGSTFLRVGQSTDAQTSNVVPDYIDILRVESSLEDQTLTAVFYLKNLPQDFNVNREGLADQYPESNRVVEYTWVVDIDVEGISKRGFAPSHFDHTHFDYSLRADILSEELSSDSSPTTLTFEDAVGALLYRFEHATGETEYQILHQAGYARYHISHEDNTLTLISQVPGITDKSILYFWATDVLLGHDDISC